MPTIWGFDHIENKHTLFRGKDCMNKFLYFFKRTHTKILLILERKMLPLTKEELKSYQDAKLCYICEKKSSKKSC